MRSEREGEAEISKKREERIGLQNEKDQRVRGNMKGGVRAV